MEKSDQQSNNLSLMNQITELVRNISEERQQYLLALLKEWSNHKDRYPRKPCFIPVDYAASGRGFHDFIQDISASGMFIETREPFSIGQEIILTFSLPNHENPFKIKGEIVRTGPKGIAVKFIDLTEQRESIIKSSVMELRGNLK